MNTYEVVLSDPITGQVKQRLGELDRAGARYLARYVRESEYTSFGWAPLPRIDTWHGIDMQGDELLLEIIEVKEVAE